MKKHWIVILAICLLYGFIYTSCSNKKEQPMNVVFFLVDDLGWRDVGCYGSTFYDTPNIDKFSKEGMLFTDAYSACHVCSPTRASIMTGMYPASINLTDWLPGRREFPFQRFRNAEINQHLPYDISTLPKVLKDHGYQTAIFGKWHLGEDSASTARQGFDLHIPDWNKGWPNKGYHSPFGLEGIEDREGAYLTDRLTDEALKYIEVKQNEPFFLYLAHFAVHDPIQGREDLVEKYKSRLDKRGAFEGSPFILEGNPDAKDTVPSGEINIDVREDKHDGYRVFEDGTVKIKQHQDNVEFAAMVESMDESFGRVLAKLEELQIDDRTVVIFYADNGGMAAANFGNPNRKISGDNLDRAFSTSNLPLRGAKGWMYEGGIRVPLIIKWPGKGLQGATCNVPVTSPDFFPTILEMLEMDATLSEGKDGKSLANLVKGEKSLDREAIFWHFPHYSNHGMQSPGAVVRSGDYKLLEYFENNSVQLFNLKDDIGEQNDLSKKEPEKVNSMRKLLHNWQKRSGAKFMEPNPDYFTK